MAKIKSDKEIERLWNQIDQNLKKVDTDSEIVGKPDYDGEKDDMIPAILRGTDDRDDKYNIYGGWTAKQLNAFFEETEEKLTKRLQRYKMLEKAQEHPEMAGTLNIYADEATSEDKKGKIIHVQSEDDKVKTIIEELFERIGMEDLAWQVIRNMCGYGDDFYEVVVSQNAKRVLRLNYIPRNMVQRIEENGQLKGFKPVFQQAPAVSETFYYWKVTKDEKDKQMVQPWRICHFKIGSTGSSRYDIYGEAVLDSTLTVISKLQMMEKALVIARVTRSPERRIYRVDVGTLQGDKAIRYAKEAVKQMVQKKALDTLGSAKVTTQREIFGAAEDLVIPVRSDTTGNSVDTLPQLNNPGDVGDLEYFRDKIFPGLGVPRQYLFDDTFANANTNLSSKSVPFAKKIRRIQRFFLYNLYKLATIELRLRGYKKEITDQFVLFMNNPSNIDENERVTMETAKWTLINTIKAIPGPSQEVPFYPDFLIYKNYLGLSDEEIIEVIKLNILQASKKNPFNIFPDEEKPAGAQDITLDVGAAPEPGAEGGEGGEVPPEAAAALGTAPDAAGGTTPEGGGEAPEQAAPSFGTPDAQPETAEFNTLKDRAMSKKQNLLQILSEEEKIFNEIVDKSAERSRTRITKRAYAEHLNLRGEFDGLDDATEQKIIYEDYTPTEEQKKAKPKLHRR
jgi:hypothetical protein